MSKSLPKEKVLIQKAFVFARLNLIRDCWLCQGSHLECLVVGIWVEMRRLVWSSVPAAESRVPSTQEYLQEEIDLTSSKSFVMAAS